MEAALLVALWLLLGCAEEDAAQPCRVGFERDADGHCYPPAVEDTAPPPGIDDALANLPACVPTVADGAIDLEQGCASGACVGATEAQISEALGLAPTCWQASSTRAYCVWDIGVEGLFDDLDADGFPDPEAPNLRVHLYAGYPGGTVQGLGVPVTTSCFVEALGKPDWVAFRDVGGELRIQDIVWDRYGLQAYDWGWDDGSDAPDGRIDNLYLYGAP